MRQKGFTPVVILILVAILAGIILFVYKTNYLKIGSVTKNANPEARQTSSPSPTQFYEITDSEKGLKTFKSDNYGLSFSFANSMYFSQSDSTDKYGQFLIYKTEPTDAFRIEGLIMNISISDSVSKLGSNAYTFGSFTPINTNMDKVKAVPVGQFIDFRSGTTGDRYTRLEDIVVDGKPRYNFDLIPVPGTFTENYTRNGVIYNIIIESGDKFIVISGHPSSEFNQILSTFKFE